MLFISKFSVQIYSNFMLSYSSGSHYQHAPAARTCWTSSFPHGLELIRRTTSTKKIQNSLWTSLFWAIRKEGRTSQSRSVTCWFGPAKKGSSWAPRGNLQTMKKVTRHLLSPKSNVRLARYKIRTLKLKAGGPVNSFLKKVRVLVKEYKFTSLVWDKMQGLW